MRYLAVVFLIASLPGLAQNSEQYRACNDKAKTQGEMNACASEEAARVEALDLLESLLAPPPHDAASSLSPR